MREVVVTAAKTLVFTVLVPGTGLVAIPYYLISREAESDRLDLGRFHYPGLIVTIAGGLLYLFCAWRFTWEGRGAPAPIDPQKTLVVRGPYRLVRNPMYVGVLTAGFGVSVWFGPRSVFVFCVFMTAVCFAVVVLYEEPALRAKFGPAYKLYSTDVPRFFPRIFRRRRSAASSNHD